MGLSEGRRSAEPRRHHYVPSFLLAGFTDGGTERDFLWVLDRVTGTQWRSRPKNAAIETDFYLVGGGNNAERDFGVEEFLAIVESGAAPIVRSLVDGAELAAGSAELEALLVFVTIGALRTPWARDVAKSLVAANTNAIAEHSLVNDNAWASFNRHRRASGEPTLGEDERESLLTLLRDPARLELEIPREYLLQLQLALFQPVGQCLQRRDWQTLRIRTDDQPLLCSDVPVVVRAMAPSDQSRPFGFGSPGTVVVTAIHQTCGLVGYWPGEGMPADLGAGWFNKTIAGAARRYLYLPRPIASYPDLAGTPQ